MGTGHRVGFIHMNTLNAGRFCTQKCSGGWCSGAGHVVTTYKALGSIPSTKRQGDEKLVWYILFILHNSKTFQRQSTHVCFKQDLTVIQQAQRSQPYCLSLQSPEITRVQPTTVSCFKDFFMFSQMTNHWPQIQQIIFKTRCGRDNLSM